MKRILLVGAGTGHLAVLRALRKRPLEGARVGLVSPLARQVYSGMLPGVIAGHYRREQAEVDVARLAAAAGVEFIPGEVVALDAARRSARLAEGAELEFDHAVLNAGSLTDTAIPGSADALPVKPFDRLLERLSEVQADHVAVIGGGAAGIELAMALRCRVPQVSVYSEGTPFVPRLAARAAAALRRQSVNFLAMPVARLELGSKVITATTEAAYDKVVLATGAAALPWLAASGLACDERGFVQVDATLRSLSHPEVFALGDCAALPLPKSGVFSLRQGEVLAKNLYRLARDEPLAPYRAQHHALLLLSCGRRYAIAQRGGWSAEGRWVWWWKDRIDRGWVRSLSA